MFHHCAMRLCPPYERHIYEFLLTKRGRGTMLRLLTATLALSTAALISTADARVTRIVVDNKISPAFDGATFGTAGQYETLSGQAFGELDPYDPRNVIIQDITLAPRNARGMVEYTATFQLVKPIDMSKASRLMRSEERRVGKECRSRWWPCQ